jgi:hypothetical protein
MVQHERARNARKVLAHWYPMLWYIWLVNKTVHAPHMDRRNVLAARAEAAWDWYVSTMALLVGYFGRRGDGTMGGDTTKIIIAGVIEENEADADQQSSHHTPGPVDVRIAAPGKNEKPDGDQEAREHHRDQPYFRWWVAVKFSVDLQVVLVH